MDVMTAHVSLFYKAPRVVGHPPMPSREETVSRKLNEPRLREKMRLLTKRVWSSQGYSNALLPGRFPMFGCGRLQRCIVRLAS